MSVNYLSPMHAPFLTVEGTEQEDILQDMFDVTRNVTIAGGQGVIPRGQGMGKIPGGKKWVISIAGAKDGLQVIRGILLVDVDTSLGDVGQIVGLRGTCNGAGLVLGAGHTLANLKQGIGISSLIDLQSIIG